MHKHTKGEWFVGCFVNNKDNPEKCQCRYIFSPNYEGSIAEISLNNGKTVGDGGNDSPPLDDAIGNAYLIAAALDIYEALKKAHNCATLRNDGTCDGCFVSAALDKADGKH